MNFKQPFSISIAGSQMWIYDDCPKTTRMGIIHLVYDLIDKKYIENWNEVDKEVRRINREDVVSYRDTMDSYNKAEESFLVQIHNMKWAKVFDFCERLYSHLSTEVSVYNSFSEYEVEVPRPQVQNYIEIELKRIFVEENLAFDFHEGQVRRRGKWHTNRQVNKVQSTLGDERLNEARRHFKKAIQYYEKYSEPDYENVVKEAVCAIEAAAKRLFPDVKANTLGEFIKKHQGIGEGQIPSPIAKTIEGLYGYRNAGEGVSHGGAKGGKVTPEIAEYVLSVSASQIILLYDTSTADNENVPF